MHEQAPQTTKEQAEQSFADFQAEVAAQHPDLDARALAEQAEVHKRHKGYEFAGAMVRPMLESPHAGEVIDRAIRLSKSDLEQDKLFEDSTGVDHGSDIEDFRLQTLEFGKARMDHMDNSEEAEK